jgi:hypothetical protein
MKRKYATPIHTRLSDMLTTGKRKQRVCLGLSDFNRIVESGGLFIDKSLLVKEFMDAESAVDVILRPRRFGKSTNLKMLQSFLSTESIGAQSRTKQFFDRCLIGQNTHFMEQHFQKYPVVFLNLKGCEGGTWEVMKTRLWRCIQMMYEPHLAELSGSLALQDFNFDSMRTPASELLEGSLMLLIRLLYRRVGKRVIVLIDEYDAPLNHAFRGGFFDVASEFFASFFSFALKDNEFLQKACLLGIVEIRGANLLSSLNNMCIYSVADTPYSEFFGFSVQEIQKIVESEEILSNILGWYNGYTIGGRLMINPWSFLSYYMHGVFRSYWIDTSFTATLRTILEPHLRDLLLTTFQLLFGPDPVPVPSLCSKVDYSSRTMDLPSVVNFLVHTGYLSYCPKDSFIGIVRIPNHEVRQHWNVHVVKIVHEKVLNKASVSQTRLQESFTANPFSSPDLQEVMGELLYTSISYMDTESDNSYHCFYLGCFKTALDELQSFKVKSNRESGTGRYDIVVVIEIMKRVIIFELKQADSEAKLDDNADEALRQAFQKDYSADFKGYECYLIGVAFFKKVMSRLKVHSFTA